MCRLFGRRVMHSTHPSPSPLSPFFAPTCASQTLPPSFLSTHDERTRALSLSFSLSIFLSVPTVRVYRKQTRLFSNLPNLNSSSIGSDCCFFFFFFFFQMTRSSSSVRDLKCVSRGIFFSRFRKWRSLLGRERGGWLFVLKTTRGRWERE